MKKILLLSFIFFFTQHIFSQGNSVANAEQFCAGGSELVFPNITGSPNATAVGCLGTIPNAAYYYLQIDQPGDLFFTISQEDTVGNPIDVDFIAWGPFASVAAANAAITLTDCPACPNNTTDPTFYPYTPDNIIDCSYDIAPTESMTITGATTGEIYIVLITNYNGSAGNISFQQTGGTGTTSCANLPVCGNVFYDSGGDSGSYSNNETDTVTIYPYVAGGTVTVDFTSFNVAAGDVLTVYNGPNDTYPVLGTVNSAPASYTSTDASGTLTFVFTSNASGVDTGWEANITCTAPPVCGSTFYDSGGASGAYSNYENEIYTFYPDTAGDAVTATFTFFDIEACCDDFYVYDGPNATSPLIGIFSGTALPGPFTSSHATGALTFVFVSDISVTNGGWAANLTCAPYTPTPVCGSTFYDSGGVGGDYSDNESTTTTFYPDTAGDAITATFTFFDVEGCCDDFYVYDGPDVSSPLIGIYSGTTIPGPFTSSHATGALTFVFVSDSSVTNGGWAADLTCAPYTPTPVCGTTFYDSGGVGGDYSDNESTTTTFYPDTAGDAITTTFTFFDIESCCDDFYVYDGPDASSPLIGVYSGTSIPGPFTSSHATGALTFVFVSDSSVTNGGWVADITCSTITPECGDIFYDSGGASGNYSNNENTTTVISPTNAGEAVTATFNSFNLASGDTLEVLDGATSLGVFTGTTIPGPFTATDPSGELTFIFSSNGTGTQSGWAADITCSILCDLSITETLEPIGADACSLDYSQLVATSSAGFGSTTTIFEENFNGATFPAGWITNNQTTNTQWIISNTNNSGGTANEAMLDWISGTTDTGNWILRSPAINITGETNLQLSLKHYLWHFSSSYPYSIYVQTNLDGAGWITQYSSINVANNIGPENLNIDLSSLTGNSLRIRFRMNGNPFGFFYWTVDDILLTADSPPTPPQITWSPTTGLYTDSGLTTPYAGGFTDTVYAAPYGTVTYTAEDQNGCTDTVTVTRNRKIWNGSVDNEWNRAANWTPNGIPTASDCIVVPDVTTTSNNSPTLSSSAPPIPPPPGLGRSLRVESNGLVEVQQYSDLVITDAIYVENTLTPNGKIILRSGSNLVQITNTGITNTGNIQMQRTVNGLAPQDYVYWASPVDGFDVNNVSPGSSLIYKWIPTIGGNGAGNYGNWQATGEIMQDGVGYIIRGVSGTSPEGVAAANTVEFVGTPKNGAYSVPISRGSYNGIDYPGAGGTMATALDDNWNLLGNPYPSAIWANEFIAQNAALDGTPDPNTPSIFGTVYLWRHQTAPSATADPFYGDFVYNYNPNDYIGYNSTGSNPPGFNGNIASGQSFFVLMDHAATTPSNVVFNNDMRLNGGTPNDNNEFFRSGHSNSNRTEIERHRIWLDLISPNNMANSILVGYVEHATNSFDRLYDGFELSETSTRFYSINDNNDLAIQGRVLPFDETDLVPLGIEIPNTGNYSIAINNLDGLFEDGNQDIYLEDTYLDFIHDLRVSPYSFISEAGEFNDRFILRYTNQALSVDSFETDTAITISAPNSSYILVKAKQSPIKSIVIYDVLGRPLYTNPAVNALTFNIYGVSQSDGVLFVKAELENGIQKVQKVVLKH